MARANRWSMSDRQKFFLAGLMVIGAFVALFGVGLGSAPVAGLGAVLTLLGPALVVLARVRGDKEYVYGTAHVHEVSPPPAAGNFGRAEFQLIVNARGVNGVPVHARDAAVPTSKWPDVGATLPVMVAVENPRRVNILWNEVLTHREVTQGGSPFVTDDGPAPPRPVRQTESNVYEYSPTPADGGAAEAPTLTDLPPVPAQDRHPAPDKYPLVEPDPEPEPDPDPDPDRGPDPDPPADRRSDPEPAPDPQRPPLRRPSPRPRQPVDEHAAQPPGEPSRPGVPVTAPGIETFSTVGPGGGAGLAVLPSTRAGADAAAAAHPDAQATADRPVALEGLPVRVPAPRPYMSPLERPAEAAAAPPAGDPQPVPDGPAQAGPERGDPVRPEPGGEERRTPGQTLEFILRESQDDPGQRDAGSVIDELEVPPTPSGAVAQFLAPGPPDNGVPSPRQAPPHNGTPGEDPAGNDATPLRSAAPTTTSAGTAVGVNGVSVTLIVADLQRSRHFYRDILGMEEVASSPQTSVLAFGDAGVVLRQVTDMQPIDRRLMYLNLEVPDVHQEYERLHAHGITFVHKPRVVAHGDQLDLCSAMFRDPDGHAVTLMRWEVRR